MPTFDEPEVKPKSGYGGGGSSRPKETIYASANAYRDMNRTLGNFYKSPKEDPEKEEMRKELEDLREMAYNQQTERNGGRTVGVLAGKVLSVGGKVHASESGTAVYRTAGSYHRYRKQAD